MNRKRTEDKTLTIGQKVLEAVLRYEMMTPVEFTKAIGMPYRTQALYEIRGGRTARISDRLINYIVAAKPYYNKEWLRTGQGEMFCKDVPRDVNTPAEEVKPNEIIADLLTKNRQLTDGQSDATKQLIDAANAITAAAERMNNTLSHIDALTNLIEKLTDVIATMSMNTPKNAV